MVIIGSGIAGCSAAIWCHRLGLRAVWLEGADAIGGQLQTLTHEIHDYPGLRVADGPAFVDHLRRHLAGLGLAPRLRSPVVQVQPPGSVTLENGVRLSASSIIVCTGVQPRALGLPGEQVLAGVHAVPPEPARIRGMNVIVAGGGDAAVENAIILASGGAQSVTLVHRGSSLRARRDFRRRLGADVRRIANAVVTELYGASGALEAVGVRTPTEVFELPAQQLIVNLGFEPRVDLLRGVAALGPRDYPVVDSAGRSSEPWLFVGGDLATPQCPSLVAAAGQAMGAVKAIATLLG